MFALLKQTVKQVTKKSTGTAQKLKTMKQTSTIIQVGVNHTLEQMKNPVTNIMLCVELLNTETSAKKKKVYYKTIQLSALRLETSIREVCSFFKEQNEALSVGRKFITQKKL